MTEDKEDEANIAVICNIHRLGDALVALAMNDILVELAMNDIKEGRVK